MEEYIFANGKAQFIYSVVKELGGNSQQNNTVKNENKQEFCD